jgi:hypothetical protein
MLSLLSIYDEGGVWIWRIILYVLGFVALLDFLVQACFLRGTDSIVYLLKHKGRAKTEEVLNRVFFETAVKKKLDEYENALSKGKI